MGGSPSLLLPLPHGLSLSSLVSPPGNEKSPEGVAGLAGLLRPARIAPLLAINYSLKRQPLAATHFEAGAVQETEKSLLLLGLVGQRVVGSLLCLVLWRQRSTEMALAVSDELLGTFVPIAVYWLYSGLYIVLDGMGMDDYRLHPKGEEATKNIVSRWTVVKGVLVQQAFQIAVSLLLFTIIGDESGTVRKQPPSMVIVLQFIIAMFVMDTWQYFMHRYMHINKFLYKHVHSKHHTLVVQYAFGALYNHPLEGLILDTIGGALSFLISGMTPRMAIFFFSFATVKTVDDHCGLWLPGNILHAFFSNNSAYHDIHHQLYGNKYNFSQPFFVMWDKILGTYMPYSLENRKGGGFEARPVKLNLAEQSKND